MILTLLLSIFLLIYIGGVLDNYQDRVVNRIVETDARIKYEEGP